MGFEIDYIPVDAGDRSGDAIALRFGNLDGPRKEQAIVVIDGGFTDSGQALVRHISEVYNSDSVDLVIATHPDEDHVSGLKVVLEELAVGALLMHQPWNHADEIKDLFQNGKISSSKLERNLEKALQHASDLEQLAMSKGIPIYEPFQGTKAFGDTMHVLGPSPAFYGELIPNFRNTPKAANPNPFLSAVSGAVKKAVEWIQDSPLIDLINDDTDTTSPENNSSAIILFNLYGHKLLFTGDAGKTALLRAIDYAKTNGISLTDLRFLDVPHHGSKRNLSSRVLKSISAPTSFISASKESTKHPAKKITNALLKRSSKVIVTRGSGICLSVPTRDRPGWGPATLELFHDRVEA